MNKTLKIASVAGGLLLAGAAAAQVEYDYAPVVEVRPIVQIVFQL